MKTETLLKIDEDVSLAALPCCCIVVLYHCCVAALCHCCVVACNNCIVMDVLRDGTVSERKEVLKNVNTKLVKTLVNIIGNVVETDTYIEDIIKPEVLSRYTSAYEDLLDRDVPLQERKKILQKAGHVYLPIFLEIVGDDVEKFEPKEVNRTLRDCPVRGCKSKQLKKLSNHLKQVHGINDRKELLQQAKESALDTDDDETDDEESNTDETDDDETDDDTESNQESD